MELTHGLKVEVYRNLHKKCWSVRHKGIVIAHLPYVVLYECSFVVQPAGNAKVRREKRKTVHAMVRGRLFILPGRAGEFPEESIDRKCLITYDPYQHTSFMSKETWTPVSYANMVLLDMTTGVYAHTFH